MKRAGSMGAMASRPWWRKVKSWEGVEMLPGRRRPMPHIAMGRGRCCGVGMGASPVGASGMWVVVAIGGVEVMPRPWCWVVDIVYMRSDMVCYGCNMDGCSTDHANR
jgi:hypothetical protein